MAGTPLATLVVEVDARTDGLQRKMGGATQAIQKFDTKARKMSRSVRGSSQSVIALGQGIQDLPFGLRGVTNNVEFLAQNLTQMSGQMDATTGKALGMKGALAAMGSSMMGPAGLLVAFSAVTAATQIWGDDLVDLISSSDDATISITNLKDAASKLIKVDLSGFSEFILPADVDRLQEVIDLLESAPETMEAAFVQPAKALLDAGVAFKTFRSDFASSDFDTILEQQADAAGVAADKVQDYVDELKALLVVQRALRQHAGQQGLGGPKRPGPEIRPFEDRAGTAFRELRGDLNKFSIEPPRPGPQITTAFTTLEEDLLDLSAGMERFGHGALIPIHDDFKRLSELSGGLMIDAFVPRRAASRSTLLKA